MTRVARATAAARPWRMPRRVYDRMIETGILGEDDPIELLDGRLVVAEPKHSPHETSVRLVERALSRVFPEGCVVSVGAPLALGEFSAPEADVSIVRGTIRDFRDAHPTEAALVVEVSQSSLRTDRRIKRPIYAAARIPEYWIVNLVDQVLEVYRDPATVSGRRSDYRQTITLSRDEAVSPLAAPESRISVADLLP